MKKRSLVALAVVLVLALSFVLVACGGDPLVAPSANIEAVEFTRGMTLESIALPEGFSWKDAKTPVTIGKVEYDATYTYGDESVAVKLPVEVKPTKSMLEEDETVTFIEKTLKSDDYKKDGKFYASSQYDQYVMILARSKKGLDADIKTAYMARVKDIVMPAVDPATNVAIDANYTNFTNNTVPTLLAMGESTTIDGVDLAAPFYSEDIILANDPYGANSYALITIKNLTIPAKYKTKDGVEHTSTTTVDKVVNAIVNAQNTKGYWESDEYAPNDEGQWVPTGNKIVSIDNTTNAIIALAEFYDKAEVKTAIDKAVAYLNGNIIASGSVDSWGDNISSTASYISGLTAVEIDPATVKNATSSKTVLDYVASQKINEGAELGGYVYALESQPELIGKANFFSTKDASIAMISYNRYLRGDKNFYEFK